MTLDDEKQKVYRNSVRFLFFNGDLSKEVGYTEFI